MILTILGISTAKCSFLVILKYKRENLNKIWKFKNPRWRPPLTFLFDNCCHGNQLHTTWFRLNWKYKWSLLYVPSFMSIGWILSKVERGGPIDLLSRLRVTIFSSRLLGLDIELQLCWIIAIVACTCESITQCKLNFTLFNYCKQKSKKNHVKISRLQWQAACFFSCSTMLATFYSFDVTNSSSHVIMSNWSCFWKLRVYKKHSLQKQTWS